jgi:hypothetical protein
MDSKIDDAIPKTGNVIVFRDMDVGGSGTYGFMFMKTEPQITSPSCSSGAAGSSVYNLSTQTPVCALAFKFQ